jgi:hypothetical protein
MAMKLRRFRRHRADDAGGDDSFLDIVANLVGVLIILVVIVGARAGSRIHEIAISKVEEAELQGLRQNHQSALRQARNLLNDNHQLQEKIAREQRLQELRQAERDELLVQVGQVRQELETRKDRLSENHREVLEQSGQLAVLRREFREIDSQYTSLQSVNVEDQTIEHYPTPIAKTVFSDEIHFRLRGGRLVYVPMNELVELMRDEWREKARKLQTASETLETVGPVGDFRLQYYLRAEDRTLRTPYGDTTDRFIEFARFVMVPVSEAVGVPLEQALQEESDFRNWISLSRPERTTVSVWVYPDSFAEFNQLKKWLYERGFKTACWPLSDNSPISGGPSGYRSTAQ